jgi:DNA-binding SARP family transcriptional activator
VSNAVGSLVPPALGLKPALPFVLGTRWELDAGRQLDAIVAELETLHTLANESRRELELLKVISNEILDSIKPRSVSLQPGDPSAATPAPALDVRLLGRFEVRLHGKAIERWPSRKARLLLAYLTIERGRTVPKDILVDLFWPDVSPERGSNNLSIAVHQLRSTLSAVDPLLVDAVVVRQGMYSIAVESVSVDLWEFQAELRAARRALERKDDDTTRAALLRAVEICQGDLLESDPYEEWATEPRRTLSVALNQSLAWLSADAARAGEWPRVVELSRRILTRDRCDETAHRWLMTAHVKSGNRPQALQQYRTYEETLQQELGVGPSEEMRLLHEQLLAA